MTQTPSDRALQIQQLSFRYSPADPTVLNIPELSIPQGQFVSLLGASGCGKSTLLRIIAGLLPGNSEHTPADPQKHQIGMVFQNANLVPWRTAFENVALPAELGTPKEISAAEIMELFQVVGLNPADAQKRPTELSGGMQMRVSLARSLVLSPTLLLLDEPFGAIDDVLRMQLEEDLRRIHQQRDLTTILVTHNISEAVFMSDRILVLGGIPSHIAADIPICFPCRDESLRQLGEFHQHLGAVTEKFRAAAKPS